MSAALRPFTQLVCQSVRGDLDNHETARSFLLAVAVSTCVLWSTCGATRAQQLFLHAPEGAEDVTRGGVLQWGAAGPITTLPATGTAPPVRLPGPLPKPLFIPFTSISNWATRCCSKRPSTSRAAKVATAEASSHGAK